MLGTDWAALQKCPGNQDVRRTCHSYLHKITCTIFLLFTMWRAPDTWETDFRKDLRVTARNEAVRMSQEETVLSTENLPQQNSSSTQGRTRQLRNQVYQRPQGIPLGIEMRFRSKFILSTQNHHRSLLPDRDGQKTSGNWFPEKTQAVKCSVKIVSMDHSQASCLNCTLANCLAWSQKSMRGKSNAFIWY